MASGCPWFERTWDFDSPAAKFPELVERLRGAPLRALEYVAGLAREELLHRDGGWSVLQHLGHLGAITRLL